MNTSGEFHKTKEYPPWEWITDREQLKEIESLSRENHEVTSALSSSLVGVHMGFITVDAIKEKLTVVVDTALSGLD